MKKIWKEMTDIAYDRRVDLNHMLIHITELDTLYQILRSGYLYSAFDLGLSVRGDGPSCKYVYLSTDNRNPLPGQAKLVFDPIIMEERQDYWMNLDWCFGPQPDSYTPDRRDEWLAIVNGKDNVMESNEIMFAGPVPLTYLRSIHIPKHDGYVTTESGHVVDCRVDFDRIAPQYKSRILVYDPSSQVIS